MRAVETSKSSWNKIASLVVRLKKGTQPAQRSEERHVHGGQAVRSAHPVSKVPKLGRELSLEVAVQKFEVVWLSAKRR